MENLLITIIQADLVWENKQMNLGQFSKKIDAISDKTDVIVLPEMFTTGFSMNVSDLAETMADETLRWFKKTAKAKDAVITGSCVIKENGKFYNRLIWMQPDGQFSTYDKKHLFRFAGETDYYTSGNEKLIVNVKGWRICPLICFDLRFPVWSRNTCYDKNDHANSVDFDCLLYIANWPEARREAWNTLLRARAHENQCYVVGVNRVGVDGKQISYSGDSCVIDPKGVTLSTIQPNEEKTQTIELSKSDLMDYRAKFPVALEADGFSIIK